MPGGRCRGAVAAHRAQDREHHYGPHQHGFADRDALSMPRRLTRPAVGPIAPRHRNASPSERRRGLLQRHRACTPMRVPELSPHVAGGNWPTAAIRWRRSRTRGPAARAGRPLRAPAPTLASACDLQGNQPPWSPPTRAFRQARSLRNPTGLRGRYGRSRAVRHGCPPGGFAALEPAVAAAHCVAAAKPLGVRSMLATCSDDETEVLLTDNARLS